MKRSKVKRRWTNRRSNKPKSLEARRKDAEDLVAVIQTFFILRRYMPTLAQLADAMGCCRSQAQLLLLDAEELGMLTRPRDPELSRRSSAAIEITKTIPLNFLGQGTLGHDR